MQTLIFSRTLRVMPGNAPTGVAFPANSSTTIHEE